jgi:PIN domain nuclease of toxin-antitoxin system
MDYIIDTQAFIWYATGDERLSLKARDIIESNEIRYISIASIWEMAIKSSAGKLNFESQFEIFIQNQLDINEYAVLEIERKHIFHLLALPFHHRDPFDRMLIAQSLSENISVVSIDAVFDLYSVSRIW